MFLSLYCLWLRPPAQCGIYGVLHLPQPYDFLPEMCIRDSHNVNLLRQKVQAQRPAKQRATLEHRQAVSDAVDVYKRQEKWSFSTYDGNISTINNYIIPTIGKIGRAHV